MNSILIVSGHTNLDNSFANKIILAKLEQLLPEAEFDYLDKLYPDYQFDVAAEQQKLMNADIIVLQFPVFWYGVPSLMKKWFEDVFVHGFSHGASGDKLHGKKIIASFTTGAPASMYAEGSLQGYPIEAFLPPLKQTANLSGMEWAGHLHTGGLSYANRADAAKLAEMKEAAERHAGRLFALLETL